VGFLAGFFAAALVTALGAVFVVVVLPVAFVVCLLLLFHRSLFVVLFLGCSFFAAAFAVAAFLPLVSSL